MSLIYPNYYIQFLMLKQSQSSSSRNGSFTVAVEGNQMGRNVSGSNATAWLKLVANLYPLGTAIR